MRKVSSVLFRKHPGGIHARVKWVRWLLGYGLLSSVLLFIFSVILMFSPEPLTVPVRLAPAATDTLSLQQQLQLMPGLRGDAVIHDPNLLDRIMLDHPDNRLGWTGALFWALICWFSIRILNELDLQRPFTLQVSRHIHAVVSVLYVFLAIKVIRWWYSYVAARNTGNSLIPDPDLMQSGFTGYLVLALLLTVIAYIYRTGCRMQEDQELTV